MVRMLGLVDLADQAGHIADTTLSHPTRYGRLKNSTDPLPIFRRCRRDLLDLLNIFVLERNSHCEVSALSGRTDAAIN